MTIHPASAADLESMASLAAGQQRLGEGHIGYLGVDADSIQVDIAAVDGWTESAFVVRDRDGSLTGWLLGEEDRDMSRVWWWGPFVVADQWDSVADSLYRHAKPSVTASEEEMAPDERNRRAAAFATRHGFVAETASAVLSYPGEGFAGTSGTVPLEADLHDAVASLHDRLFPATHTTGAALVASDDVRLVIVDDGVVLGYVAAERHSDGTGYIDYLGVEPSAQGRGIGRRLVAGAVDALVAQKAMPIHLSVRESNAPARLLYAALGFVEERIIRPYRKGFSLSAS
jgi:ribosomal protein S18 acetylase RimI-like enzyme